MQDYQAQAEKLRKDAAECALIRDLATDPAKRELFDRLASHLTVLADQVELALIQRGGANLLSGKPWRTVFVSWCLVSGEQSPRMPLSRLGHIAMPLYRMLENPSLGLGPKAVRCVIEAYEQTLQTLSVKERDDPLTEMIAREIIKLAQTGVHDPAELSALAIKELSVR
jgi:hypothetical protein